MIKIPKFRLFGQNDAAIEEIIQPRLEMRSWDSLTVQEKGIALQQLVNDGWVKDYSGEILKAISDLNYDFLRICPGKRLHSIPKKYDLGGYSNERDRTVAAFEDFKDIFLQGKPQGIVFRMLTIFAASYIDGYAYSSAKTIKDDKEKKVYLEKAFSQFDRLANCLNHIFEQFAVNAVMTRNGLIPRQDEKIIKGIYAPTLQVLSDPRWKDVSDDLGKMFIDFQAQHYSEAITKAHSSIQRFLQILVGEEGKNSKGEVADLFKKAKQENAIPINRFTEPMIDVLQKYLVSQRATNSTAKPTIIETTSSDALLVMNITIVFLQHCLQK